jgi:glucose-1-phosphate cytidylyltransferase
LFKEKLKAVILAGGMGTRLSEETQLKPKPMIEIGGMPILWHIMKTYGTHGINDFVICLGYKGYIIKEFFANYFLHSSDVTIDIQKNNVEVHSVNAEPWKITLVDTGENTMTGGRVKKIQKYVDDTFCLTYGDGVTDLNICELINHHKKQNVFGTITAVQPPGRFGSLVIENQKVVKFQEKPKGDNSWINGGFFIFEKDIFDYIDNDNTILEKEPLENISKISKLSAFEHNGFWHAMDTLRDKNHLDQLWRDKKAPWKIW